MMKDYKGIPEQDYKELWELMGDENALKYLKKTQYNYRAVVTKILFLKIGLFARRKPLLFWAITVIVFILLFAYFYDIVSY